MSETEDQSDISHESNFSSRGGLLSAIYFYTETTPRKNRKMKKGSPKDLPHPDHKDQWQENPGKPLI
jgi:hypothetical protein